MTHITPVKAACYRIRAQRLERQVADLMHRVTVADPHGRHPETGRDLATLAQDGINAHAIANHLNQFLEAQQ